jgi:hypothetical protein
VKPGTLLCALLAILGLTGSLVRAGVTAILVDQAQNTGNTFTAASCFPGDTGLLDSSGQATDTGGDDNGFELNATDAFADGGGYASNVDGAGDRHRYYDYGISIPSGCSVKGIKVRLDWWLDSTDGDNSMSVELSWDSGASWTAAETDSTESTSEHTATLGSSTNTWGRTWTSGELGDDYFRVRVTSNSDSSFRDFYLDWVPVSVYYGAGGGGGASAPAVIIPVPPATSTPTPVVTPTPIHVPANTQTPTPIATPALTPIDTATSVATPVDTPTSTPTPEASPIDTPTLTPADTATPIATPTSYPFAVPTPIATPTPYPFAVPTPIATPALAP